MSTGSLVQWKMAPIFRQASNGGWHPNGGSWRLKRQLDKEHEPATLML